MGDNELICNFKKCRKKLSTFAWVTACSHIFCDEDGTRQFAKSLTCPACESSLSAKCDLIRMDLRPSEQYKSMVLAGQKPETVMEICSRAISFWMYQTEHEKSYQEFVATKAKERSVQLEHYYEQILTRSKTELTRIEASKKELDALKQKHHDLTEQFSEKNRQYHKLQSNYEQLKRKHINPRLLESEYDEPLSANKPAIPGFASSLPFGGGDGAHVLLGSADELRKSYDRPSSRESLNSSRASAQPSPAVRDDNTFVFRPQHTPLQRTPVISTEASISSLQSRFNMELGSRTPPLAGRSAYKNRT